VSLQTNEKKREKKSRGKKAKPPNYKFLAGGTKEIGSPYVVFM